MRQVALGLAAVFGLGGVGVGLEVAHPVLLPSEPLVLWTVPGESPPSVAWGPFAVPLDWRQVWEGERLRWEGKFPLFSPPGVWLVCTDRSCEAVLRVGEGMGIVEVRAAPGTVLLILGQEKLVGKQGWAFFVVPPGEHLMGAVVHGEQSCYGVRVLPAKRVEVTLVFASPATSSSIVLPGTTLTLCLRIISPRDLATLGSEWELPSDWEVSPLLGVYDPLRRGEMAVRCWHVAVPPSAAGGEYTVAVRFPELEMEVQTRLTVSHRLPPRAVVCHWDVAADQLDLSQPCRITYERLLWAATFVGRELPFTGRVFTQAEFTALAAEWEVGPQAEPGRYYNGLSKGDDERGAGCDP